MRIRSRLRKNGTRRRPSRKIPLPRAGGPQRQASSRLESRAGAALDRPSARRRLPSSPAAKELRPSPSAISPGPAPNRLTLPPVLRRLERAGIPRERITILIATGLHRPATDEEIREICGPEISNTWNCAAYLRRVRIASANRRRPVSTCKALRKKNRSRLRASASIRATCCARSVIRTRRLTG